MPTVPMFWLIFLAEAVAQQRLSGRLRPRPNGGSSGFGAQTVADPNHDSGNLVTRIGFDPGGLAR